MFSLPLNCPVSLPCGGGEQGEQGEQLPSWMARATDALNNKGGPCQPCPVLQGRALRLQVTVL